MKYRAITSQVQKNTHNEDKYEIEDRQMKTLLFRIPNIVFTMSTLTLLLEIDYLPTRVVRPIAMDGTTNK